MKKNIIIIFLLFVSRFASTQPYIPGTSYFGRANYIEYIAGNLPLIISVPHGGSLTPGEISDRTCGDETVTDLYTIELAESIRKEIKELTGCSPHIIICHLKRTKLDVNRDVDIATCGNEFSEIAWNEYHLFADSAKAAVERTSGKGLLIDLHGHGHAVQRLELGYLLTAGQLANSDAVLDESAIINLSSIRNLAGTNVTNLKHSELLHGLYSLGTMFAVKGYPSVPGIDEPYPFLGEPYFGGGYIVRRHGSVEKGKIDAIQIECNQNVRFEETARDDFAAATASIFLSYLIKHYFPDLPLTYCTPVNIEIPYNSEFVVYPVPFNETLTARVAGSCQLSIYNLSGELLVTKAVVSDEIFNLDGLTGGTYLAIFSINGKVVYRCKIIKGSTGKN